MTSNEEIAKLLKHAENSSDWEQGVDLLCWLEKRLSAGDFESANQFLKQIQPEKCPPAVLLSIASLIRFATVSELPASREFLECVAGVLAKQLGLDRAMRLWQNRKRN